MNVDSIQKWLTEQKAFVAYKLPQATSISALLATKVSTLSSYDELRGYTQGFLFAPFDIHQHSILLLQGDESSLPFSPLNFSLNKANDNITVSDEYIREFDRFHQSIQKGEFSKLVLSRKKVYNQSCDALALFLEACSIYPDSMVYLIHTHEAGTWLGATPEILVEGNCIQMHTVALAGTMSCTTETPKLSDWDQKNKEEQQIVTEYMRDRIRVVGELKDEWGPYVHRVSHLAHLKTDLYFRLEPNQLPEMIESLHPTPAVCGLPKKEALQFIKENEQEDRTYYAGFLGSYDIQNTTRLFVNIRCMNWQEDSTIKLFAGGGILAASDVNKEWMETEHKMQTLTTLPSFFCHK